MIQFIAETPAELPSYFRKQLVSKWIKQVAESQGKKCGDISYIFCTDERILSVNNQYLSHDYFTDVITFDYSANKVVSGDIFISLDTVRSNAELFNVEEKEELHRVVIHGVLHLCGQGDKTEETKNEMTNKENKALRLLKSISEPGYL